jgi:phosphate starvation-inducible PhoH-like protein
VNNASPSAAGERRIPLQNHDEARILLGPMDDVARLVRETYGVSAIVRDNELRLLGDDKAVAHVGDVFQKAVVMIRKGQAPTLEALHAMVLGEADAKIGVPLQTRRRVAPRTDGQAGYVAAMRSNNIVFAIGPAGTGKTFLAVARAVEALRQGEVRKLVLARPAVEAGEKLGFLPGDFQAKVNPYLRPLYDALHDLLDTGAGRKYMENDVIEICPLAYMRGRTLNEAFIILDEAQNTTPKQMHMFLTRMGEGSRIVVTGDITQVDLPDGMQSGLVDAADRLGGIPGLTVVRLTRHDIVRHALVQQIVDAYETDPPRNFVDRGAMDRDGTRRRGRRR